MRRFLVVLVCLSVGGCGLIKFDSTITGQGTIPGTISGGGFGAGSFDAAGSLAQSFSTNGASTSAISSAKVTGGKLFVINPTQPQDSLVYIKEFQVTVSGPAPLQPQVIATIPADSLTNKTYSVDLTITPVELKPYIQSGSVTMTPVITFDPNANNRPATPVPIELSLTIHVSL